MNKIISAAAASIALALVAPATAHAAYPTDTNPLHAMGASATSGNRMGPDTGVQGQTHQVQFITKNSSGAPVSGATVKATVQLAADGTLNGGGTSATLTTDSDGLATFTFTPVANLNDRVMITGTVTTPGAACSTSGFDTADPCGSFMWINYTADTSSASDELYLLAMHLTSTVPGQVTAAVTLTATQGDPTSGEGVDFYLVTPTNISGKSDYTLIGHVGAGSNGVATKSFTYPVGTEVTIAALASDNSLIGQVYATDTVTVTDKAVVVAPAPTVAAKVYSSCAAMDRVYPHGVAKSKTSRDKTTGARDTHFRVNAKLYAANARLDKDHDGIVCER